MATIRLANNSSIRLLALTLAVVFGTLTPGQTKADIELTFGLYTSDKASVMIKKFRKILNTIEVALSNRLGEPVNIKTRVAKSYEQGVINLTSGKVDFSRFGAVSYVLAKQQQDGITILAVENSKGTKVFHGHIVVHRESRIEKLTELRGVKFGFGNKRSTIGRYLSQKVLLDAGIIASDLSEYDYLDRHDKVGAAVAAKQYEAGAIKSGTFQKMLKKGAALRAIATFDVVTKPWIANHLMEQRVLLALQQTLYSITDPEVLNSIKKQGFLPGNDADYHPIRQAIEQNPIFFM